MQSIRRTRRWVAMMIVSGAIALLLSITVSPVLAHDGVVHGEQTSEQTTQTQAAADSSLSEDAVSQSSDSEGIAPVAPQADSAEQMIHHASIGIGEILLGSIVLGPVALLQLRARL